MKIKDGYLLDSIGEQRVAVALDRSEDKFNGLIKLNAVGAFIWEQLETEKTLEEIIKAVTDNFEVDCATASRDVKSFLEKLQAQNILES